MRRTMQHLGQRRHAPGKLTTPQERLPFITTFTATQPIQARWQIPIRNRAYITTTTADHYKLLQIWHSS
jgi:hypothetical protein